MVADNGFNGSLPSCLGQLVAEAVTAEFDIDWPASQSGVTVPPNPEFGDLSTAVALRLARELKMNPIEIAERLAGRLPQLVPDVIERVTVTRPGYVNLFIDPLAAATALASGRYLRPGVSSLAGVELDPGEKVVIEHTNINPNKAAHIGHLRNACLGDSLARLLRMGGIGVEVQNYIDDTGTAVADIVVGLELLAERPEPDQRYDDFCWELYKQVHELYERDPEAGALRRRVLAEIEQGGGLAPTAAEVAKRIVDYHLDTMAMVAVDYDLLTWESHILGLQLWEDGFSRLQQSEALVHERSGPNEGCWVVPLSDHPRFGQLENPDKVLVRSDGTATYTAKDIAYQLWKFGLLDRDFCYRRLGDQWSGRPLWSTARDGESSGGRFGRAGVVLNVIDVRQSYLQDILQACLDRLGFERAARRSIHFAYELVVLSEAAAAELGLDGESLAMSGRKGVGVKAHELIARARELTIGEVRQRHPDWDPARVDDVGAAIAAAAIRYYMIRFKTSAVLAFDFTDALSLTGKTGPYLQYAYARASRILEKAPVVEEEPTTDQMTDAERQLILLLLLAPRRMEEAAEKLEVSILAEHAYELAAGFMGFYEHAPVLNAPAGVRARRLALVRLFAKVFGDTLAALGISRLAAM